MADLTIVPGDVKPLKAQIQRLTSSVAITQGQLVYDEAGLAKLAQSDSDVTKGAIGIALNSALPDQPVDVAIGGIMEPGATLTVGECYVVSSAVAGAIAPSSDLSTGDYFVYIGIAISTSQIDLMFKDEAIQKA